MAQVVNQTFKYYHLKFVKLKLKFSRSRLLIRGRVYGPEKPSPTWCLRGIMYKWERTQRREVEARNMLYS